MAGNWTKPEPVFTLEIPVYDVSDDIFFHQGVGEADFKGEPMQASHTMNGDPVLRFRDSRYMIKIDNFGLALYERLNEDARED